VDVWLDEGDLKVGDVLTKTFHQEIKKVDFFLLINSVNSADSPWVHQELQFALESGVTILPICIDESELPPVIRDHKFLEFSFSNFDDFSFPFNTLLQSMGLMDESVLRPTVTNIQFYDRDPMKYPDATPQNIFEKKLLYPRYIYVSWEPKYFYRGVRFRRKWYRNDLLFGRPTHYDVWDDIWERKQIHTTFIYNRWSHQRGDYDVRFYIGDDETVSGHFSIV